MVATLQIFFLAMLMFPDVQKKAQECLDGVLLGALPELSDLDNMPYIVAVINEVMRWQPALPLGWLNASSIHKVIQPLTYFAFGRRCPA
jgi:cytochrome P450